MEVFNFLDSDIISHSGDYEDWRMTRLYKLLGYLGGILTPVDLECILNLHDHEGNLEVTFSEKNVNKIIEFVPSYFEYLKEKIQKAWLALGETTVWIKFE